MLNVGMSPHNDQVVKMRTFIQKLQDFAVKTPKGIRERTIPLIETVVSSLEEMRKDPRWVQSLAQAAEAGSEEGWCRGHRGPPQRLRQWLKTLSKAKTLSPAINSRIETCFSPEKVLQTGATETSTMQPCRAYR